MHLDPVCGRRMNANKAFVRLRFEGVEYFLCCPMCQRTFEADPRSYAESAKHGRRHQRTGRRSTPAPHGYAADPGDAARLDEGS